MPIPMQYETKYEWKGEAEHGALDAPGHGALDMGTAGEGGRWDPEHLLVAAVETCLANSFLVVAGFSKVEVLGYRSTAEGFLLKEEKKGYRFEKILVRPVVTVAADAIARAQRVMDKAHTVCIISRSLNCPVEVEPEFVSS